VKEGGKQGNKVSKRSHSTRGSRRLSDGVFLKKNARGGRGGDGGKRGRGKKGSIDSREVTVQVK